MFGGQLLSGGLEMPSSARSISQWWMSGLCWAAEQEAAAAVSPLRSQALAKALSVRWSPVAQAMQQATELLPAWVGIYTYVAVQSFLHFNFQSPR